MLYLMFELTGEIKKNNILMTWASFPDPDNIGKSQSFTCSVKYKTGQDYGEKRIV